MRLKKSEFLLRQLKKLIANCIIVEHFTISEKTSCLVIWECLFIFQTSLVAQTVKRLPTMWEIWVRSLGGEDPLEKEMATHSCTLAWKIPWEEAGRLRVRHN